MLSGDGSGSGFRFKVRTWLRTALANKDEDFARFALLSVTSVLFVSHKQFIVNRIHDRLVCIGL